MSKKNETLRLAAFLGALVLPLMAVAEEVAETAEAAAEAAPASVNLIDLIFVKGGLFMYPIVLLCFYMVYLAIDGILVIRQKKLMPEATIKFLRDNFKRDKAEECRKFCQDNSNAFTVVVGHVLAAHEKGKGIEGMQEAAVEQGH